MNFRKFFPVRYWASHVLVMIRLRHLNFPCLTVHEEYLSSRRSFVLFISYTKGTNYSSSCIKISYKICIVPISIMHSKNIHKVYDTVCFFNKKGENYVSTNCSIRTQTKMHALIDLLKTNRMQVDM